MAASIPFGDRCGGSGDKRAQVYYIAGMPWALTDSPELVANIDTTLRRKLFGANVVASDPVTYPADEVVLIPTLDPNTGFQEISYDNKQNLKVGSWKVSFDSDNIGSNFSDIYGGDCFGLLGLDVRPRIVDYNVKIAELASEYHIPQTPGQMKVRDVAGMIDYVDAAEAADSWVPVWMGHQCLGVHTQTGPVNGVYTWQFTTIYRTKQEHFFPTDHDDRIIQIYSAPVAGVVGQPAYLFLIELDDDGTLGEDFSAVDPVMYRQGQVQATPTRDGTTWTLTHTGFTSWLNVEVPNPRLRATINGFFFSRDRASGQKPHFFIDERETTNEYKNDMWLCAEGSTVWFETKQDLADACLEEIVNPTHSRISGAYPSAPDTNATFDLEYFINDQGLQYKGDSDDWVKIAGIVPFILGWGYTRQSRLDWLPTEFATSWPVALAPWEYPRGNYDDGDNHSFDPFRYIILYNDTQNVVGDDPGFLDASGNYTSDGLIPIPNPWACEYFWQWDWSSGLRTIPDEDLQQYQVVNPSTSYQCGFIPMADLGGIGDPFPGRIYVTTDSDVDSISADTIVNVGDPENKTDMRNIFNHPLYHMEFPLHLKGEVYAIGKDVTVGSTGEGIDYIDFKKDSTTGGHLTNVLPYKHPIMYGTSLYYMPEIHSKDPWPISDQRGTEFDTPGEMLRSMLGEGGLGMRVSGQITHIPDIIDEGAIDDSRTLIDFDELDRLCQTIYPDAVYRIEYPNTTSSEGAGTKRIKLNDFINNLLLTHGLRATWEYRETQRAWMMGFTKITYVNLTEAQLTGRILDETLIISEPPVFKNAEHKLVKSLDWEGVIENRPTKLHIDYALRQHVAAAEAIKIQDIAASYPSAEEVYILLSNLYLYLALSSPIQKFGIRPKGLAMAALGRSHSMSWRALVNAATGKRDTTTTNTVGIVEKMSISLGRTNLSIRVDERAIVGISPALEFDHTNAALAGDVISLTGLETVLANNAFANPANGLTDLAHFDTYYFDWATNTVTLKSTSDDNFRVTVITRGQTSLTLAGGGRNVWHGEISAVNIVAGTATVTLDDATNFNDAAGDYILEFGDYNHADFQPWQRAFAVWGDEDGLNTTSAGVARRAATMV